MPSFAIRPWDIDNLNKSIAGVGDAFAEGRREDLANKRLDVEQDFRRQMLESEMRRSNAEDKRAERQDHILNNQQFATGVKALNEQADRIQGQVDAGAWSEEEGTQAMKGLHDTFDQTQTLLRDRSLLGAYKANGFKVKRGVKPEPKLTPVDVPPGGALTPGGHFVAPPKPAMREITEKTAAVPGTPGSEATEGGLFGIGAQPAVPAVAAQPERTIKRQVPANGVPVTDKNGIKWLYKGDAADPRTDKDPKNWVKQ